MKSFIVPLLILLSAAPSLAQYSIYGQVFDDQTNTPLAHASVFIANTTKGAATDEEGKFEIAGLYGVHYNVVVSYLGYEPVVLDMIPGSPIVYQIRLKPVAKVLHQVVVKAKKISKAQWEKYLNDFKDHFIGLSENARHCHLENEDAIDFDVDQDLLTAKADTILVLRNEGLGFRVKILLQKYEYDSKKGSVLYEGQMSYELLNPRDEKQRKRWAENRLTAYYGSQMHFFRALYNHKLNDEGFYFSLNDQMGNDSLVTVVSPALYNYTLDVKTIKDYDKVVYTNKEKEEEILRFQRLLSVTYINELEDTRYQQARKLRLRRTVQQSYLTSKEPAYVFPDGRVYPIDAAEAQGYWSWELMAEALPLDYNPVEDKVLLQKDHSGH